MLAAEQQQFTRETTRRVRLLLIAIAIQDIAAAAMDLVASVRKEGSR